MLDDYNAVQLVSQARLRFNELRPKNEINWMSSLPYPPMKTEERSMIQISLGPMIQNQDRNNPESTPKFTADLGSIVFSKSANPPDLPQKSTIRALFTPKSFDPKTY